MADNYLERKMEEYRSGNLGRRTVRSGSASTLPKGKIVVDFPQRIVIVVGDCDAISRCVVSRFISAGCKTAFCSVDRKGGAALSQSFGARFYPLRVVDRESLAEVVEDVRLHWGQPDTLIVNPDVSRIELAEILDENIIAGFNAAEGRLRIIEIVHKQSIVSVETAEIVESDKSDRSDSSDKSDMVDCSEAEPVCGCWNRIVVGEEDERNGELVGSLCVFLCEPCGRYITGQDFVV